MIASCFDCLKWCASRRSLSSCEPVAPYHVREFPDAQEYLFGKSFCGGLRWSEVFPAKIPHILQLVERVESAVPPGALGNGIGLHNTSRQPVFLLRLFLGKGNLNSQSCRFERDLRFYFGAPGVMSTITAWMIGLRQVPKCRGIRRTFSFPCIAVFPRISLPGQKNDGFHCASSSSGLNQILPDQKLFRSSSVVHALRS